MAKKVWTFKIEGQRHVVVLKHNRWRGNKEIVIDGVPFERTKTLYDGESLHHFDISGVPCVLDIKYGRKLTGFTYELFVGRKKVSERR